MGRKKARFYKETATVVDVSSSKRQSQMEKYVNKRLKQDARPSLLTALQQQHEQKIQLLKKSAVTKVTEVEEVKEADVSSCSSSSESDAVWHEVEAPFKKNPFKEEVAKVQVDETSSSDEEEEVLNTKPISSASQFVLVERDPVIQEQREQLPIYREEQRIMECINHHPVCCLVGETGSGKTTQVPQFLLEAGYATRGLIGVTQPRRVAALSMAQRVGQELGNPTWSAYQVRYEQTVGPDTRIKFMTDGILLREIQSDFLLSRYSVILLDEAHERNLNTDILIGMLTRIVKLRNKLSQNPLRLVIMSATLDVDRIATHPRLFPDGPIPVIRVEARLHPVTIHWSPRTPQDHVEAAYRMVRRIHTRLPPGTILVFLTGRREILNLVRRLGGSIIDDDDFSFDEENSSAEEEEEDCLPEIKEEEATNLKLKVLPLYSALAPELQMRIFDPPASDERLCVVATNVAETSLTIPNVRYVVDGGKVKERRVDPESGIQTYTIQWTSKASSQQRAGRAGRTAAGHCYRLFSSAVYEQQLPEHSPAEIERCSIEGLVLSLRAMGIDKPVMFPLPTAPTVEAIEAADRVLRHLGAMDADGNLSELGRSMVDIPLAPRWSCLVQLGRSSLSLALAACLSVGDPYQPDADRKCTIKPNPGDPMVWLEAFLGYCRLSPGEHASYCHRLQLQPKLMHEQLQQYRQLSRNIPNNLDHEGRRQLQKLLVRVLADRTVERCHSPIKGLVAYTANNVIYYLHPSSTLRSCPPRRVVWMESNTNSDGRIYIKGITPL